MHTTTVSLPAPTVEVDHRFAVGDDIVNKYDDKRRTVVGVEQSSEYASPNYSLVASDGYPFTLGVGYIDGEYNLVPPARTIQFIADVTLPDNCNNRLDFAQGIRDLVTATDDATLSPIGVGYTFA